MQRLENGTVRLIATTDKFPETDSERRMSQSALHLRALLEDLSDVPNLDVRVFIPPVSSEGDTIAPPTAPHLASHRIRLWNRALQDYAMPRPSSLRTTRITAS